MGKTSSTMHCPTCGAPVVPTEELFYECPNDECGCTFDADGQLIDPYELLGPTDASDDLIERW